MQRHVQAIEAMKKDAAGDDALGSSQDHLKPWPPAPKIQSIEEARRILMNFGMTEAVRQKDKELAEVHGCMVKAVHKSWYEPGLIWKNAEPESRDWLYEKEEADIEHFEVEKEYRTEKHNVVKARISSEILGMAYRTLKKR